jgi:hypothetical protein
LINSRTAAGSWLHSAGSEVADQKLVCLIRIERFQYKRACSFSDQPGELASAGHDGHTVGLLGKSGRTCPALVALSRSTKNRLPLTMLR